MQANPFGERNSDMVNELVVDAVDFSSEEFGGHICCIIPTFTEHGDCTRVYYVNGRHVLIKKPLRAVFRDIVMAEGLMVSHLKTSGGGRPQYTDPRTLGPHMTFASLKVRTPIGRSCVYGLFNVAIPFDYVVHHESGDGCWIILSDDIQIFVYHTKNHVHRKLADALREHMMYIRHWLDKTAMTENKFVISEIYSAWRMLGHR